MNEAELTKLIAEANDLVLKKTGINIAFDPDETAAKEEIVKAMWENIDERKWPREKIEGYGRYSLVNPLLQVSAERVAELKKRIAELEAKLKAHGIDP
jgi:hypothetical protein